MATFRRHQFTSLTYSSVVYAQNDDRVELSTRSSRAGIGFWCRETATDACKRFADRRNLRTDRNWTNDRLRRDAGGELCPRRAGYGWDVRYLFSIYSYSAGSFPLADRRYTGHVHHWINSSENPHSSAV